MFQVRICETGLPDLVSTFQTIEDAHAVMLAFTMDDASEWHVMTLWAVREALQNNSRVEAAYKDGQVKISIILSSV